MEVASLRLLLSKNANGDVGKYKSGGRIKDLRFYGRFALRLQHADAALKVLPPLEKRPRPEAEWPAAGASAWFLKERYAEAAAMERAVRSGDIPDHRRRASQLRLHAENPEKTQPPPKQLAAHPDPELAIIHLYINTMRGRKCVRREVKPQSCNLSGQTRPRR